ncbi:MAG: hypothetical protein LBL46_03835 [Rickettsiales bacterium]|jgi:hypothetical protein|nr:hypothetical protein [Rickettsiales bacterium]
MLNNKEQRIKNNGGLRTGKHLFIILYSLFISLAPQAQAAKLCARRVPFNYAHNTTAKIWAHGPSCKGTNNGAFETQKASGESAATTIAELCPGEIVVGGIAICSTLTYDNEDIMENGGQYCWCRMTYPKTGMLMLGWYQGFLGGCGASCATACSILSRRPAAYGMFVPSF